MSRFRYQTPANPQPFVYFWLGVAIIAFLAFAFLTDCKSAGDLQCPGNTALDIEAEYSAKILAACDGYSLKECPDYPRLDAERKQAEQKAGCR